MGKIILFGLVWLLTGNIFVTLLIVLLVIYLLDRRFIGILPSITRPLQIRNRIRQLKQSLQLNPHNTSAKQELARLWMEKKRYKEALPLLQDVLQAIPESAEVRADLGLCLLKLKELDQGEVWMLEALEINPMIQYGEPWLRLGEAFSQVNQEKALSYLERLKEVHSSSSEVHYRLGKLFAGIKQWENSRKAYQEAIDVYRSLPKYKKRSERPWAIRSSFRLALLPNKQNRT